MKNIGDITPQEIQARIAETRKIYFRSNFSFLNIHNGFRPGNLHVLMGTAGSGKSTFIRSVLGDCLESNSMLTALAWQSEESTTELQVSMLTQGHSRETLSRLNAISELDNPDKSVDDILESALVIGAKLIVFDNITTSRFYMDKKIETSSALITKLKTFAAEYEIAIVLIAHTKKDIHDNYGKLITEADIRGGSSVVNMAHFFYVLQKFQLGSEFYPTLRIIKHRGQETDHKLFYLQYESKTMSYTLDRQIDFEAFKEKFNSRNKL